MKTKLWTLASIVVVVLALDLVTKRWALDALSGGRTMDLFGGLVPLSLAFNKGAAFGLSIGDDSRWFFIPVTLVALVFLGILLRKAHPGDHLRTISVSMVMAGALGNLYDRVRWNRGVVDFIGPIDLGFMDWPIFNVADMSISCGAILLALSFWLEDRRAAGTAAAAAEAPADPGVDPAIDPTGISRPRHDPAHLSESSPG